jgi:hypothetical protein
MDFLRFIQGPVDKKGGLRKEAQDAVEVALDLARAEFDDTVEVVTSFEETDGDLGIILARRTERHIELRRWYYRRGHWHHYDQELLRIPAHAVKL